MKPFVILIAVFILGAAIARLTTGYWQLAFCGNLAMCLMLCFTAIGHFKFLKGMTLMVPKAIPFKKQLVQLTGFAEIAIGLALLFPSARAIAGILLIILLVLMLPANIKAALARIDYEKGTYSGKGPGYLWFRIPLQLFFIAWAYFFCLNGLDEFTACWHR